MEEAYLTAIQWYGDAIQELIPSVAFVKYWVAIECVLKKRNEIRTKELIPKRVATLVEQWNRAKQESLIKDIGNFIDDRNNVLHSGKPQKNNAEFLAWVTGILARQVLHQLRQKILSNHWETKDDIIQWVETQSNKLNQSDNSAH